MEASPRRLSVSPLVCALLASCCLTIAPPDASAHNDDPKIYDTLPPYDGPGIRGGTRDGDAALAQAVEFDSHRIDLLSWLTIPELGITTTGVNDCWGYVSPSGREYAIIGLYHGTSFVEITDPENPVVVGSIPGQSTIQRDIKVYQNFAYAVAENNLAFAEVGLAEAGGAIQVIDLGSIDDGIVTLRTSISEGGVTATHNVAINEESGYLYRLGGANHGMRVYDLANPAQPSYVDVPWSDRYVHDAQIVTYSQGPYAGREIAFCCTGFNGGFSQPGLDIIDVTNKAELVNISRIQYPFAAYSHQAWLSEDRKYLYLNDEQDQNNLKSTVHVIDVSDLENPVYAGSFTNGNPAITHNLYVRDGLLFEANYTSGVRIFDLAGDPTGGDEIAYFDTRPEDDAISFNGAWSVYSFFPSGNIIVSDRERGLFVLRPRLGQLSFSYPLGLPDMAAIGQSATINVHIDEGAVPVDAASVFISIDQGGQGETLIPMTHLGGNEFQGALPALACGESLDYRIVADNVDGEGYGDPQLETGDFHHIVAGSCSDGIFCNGLEACDDGECIAGFLPCLPALCDEAGQLCLPCTTDEQCTDGVFCNGAEVCDDGACQSGQAVCVGRQCDEASDICFDCETSADCDDGLFCNGAESCVNRACVDSTAHPCADGLCDESADHCVECFADMHCDDGLYCNGVETCNNGACVTGPAPCLGAAETCDEAGNACVNTATACSSASDCDDANDCTIDACNNATCTNVADPDCGQADQGNDDIAPADADESVDDDDGDGIANANDRCAGTPEGATVNAVGCSCHAFDDDGDGVMNCFDLCADSRAGMTVDEFGCTRIETPDDQEVQDDVVVDNRPIAGGNGGGNGGGDDMATGDGTNSDDGGQEAGAALPGELGGDSASTSSETGANGSGAGSAGSNRSSGRSVCGVIGVLPAAVLFLGAGLVRRSRPRRRN